MNYYRQQIEKLTKELYPDDDVTLRVVSGKQFLDKNVMLDADIKTVATHACVSLHHFIRLFRKYYGMTPYQHYTDIRMAKAKDLLRSGHSVSETCYTIGFDSLPSFSLLFKKRTGISPRCFQQRQFSINK